MTKSGEGNRVGCWYGVLVRVYAEIEGKGEGYSDCRGSEEGEVNWRVEINRTRSHK